MALDNLRDKPVCNTILFRTTDARQSEFYDSSQLRKGQHLASKLKSTSFIHRDESNSAEDIISRNLEVKPDSGNPRQNVCCLTIARKSSMSVFIVDRLLVLVTAVKDMT